MGDPENDMKEHKEAFKIFDTDKDGKLNQEEATYAFMTLGYTFSEEEMNTIMIQSGHNGLIDLKSFSDYLLKRNKDTEMEDELMECFKEMDKDHDGKISKKDLKYLLYSIGEKLTDEEIEGLINETDTTKEGFITYKDMVRLMLTK